MFFLNGLAVVSWIAGVIATSSNGNVRSTTTCNCVNQNITYECTVVGGAFTVWSGSAFMCRGREITLTHLSFTGSIGECNDGAIIAQGVRVDGNSYTSRLTVTLSPELIGTSVNCSVDTTTDLIPIGNYTLRLSSGADSFPPPRSVFLSRVGQSEISFSWSNVQHEGCPVFQYDIYSVNCGTCSSESLVATSNSTICVDFNSILLSANNTCNFTVWSVICGDIAGDSRYTTVTLKVPDPPDIKVVPVYLNETSQLSKITTTFIEVDSFNISVNPLIDGSASFYTILYTDSVSGSICDTATIMPSSCINRRCNHTFIMSSSTCSVSANITVSGFATNMLGNGRHSTPVRIDRVNRYVNVTFDPTTRRVLCQFLNPMSTNSSKCKADLKYGPSCDQEIGMYSNSSTSDSVMTPQLDFTDEVLEYCLFVTAVDDTITVTVARTLLNIGQNVHHQVSFTWIAVLVVIVILVLLIILIIVILCMCKYVCPQVKNIAFLKPANLNLSVALKVFEDNGIEDLCVSIDSLHWKVRSTSPRESATFNYIHYKSSQERLPGSEELEKGIYKFAVAQNDPKQFIKCLETLEKFDIRILGITNLNEGEVALECKCKCTRKTKQNIIRGLRSKDCKVESSRDEYPLLPFSYLNLNCYTNAKGVTANPQVLPTRRVRFSVREGTVGITRALEVFGEHHINITEVNPDYVPKVTDHKIVNENNFIECICAPSERENLCSELKSNYGVISVEILTKEAEPKRKYKHHDYCVVQFSVEHSEGSLAKALRTFVELEIKVIGVNTLYCSDEELEHSILYRKCTLQFDPIPGDLAKRLKERLNATGIAIVREPPHHANDSETSTESEISTLLLLIMKDEIRVGLPRSVEKVLISLNIKLLAEDETKCTTIPCESIVHKRMHVEHYCTNEQNDKLIAGLKATGLVVVQDDFVVPMDKTSNDYYFAEL